MIQNVQGRQTRSLNGDWRAIVDPYESGYYMFGVPLRNGWFRNFKPRTPSERVDAPDGQEVARSQTIRTAARLPIEIAILETVALPAYQRIAREAVRLNRLGLSATKIAAALRVTDKTVTKGIRWTRRLDMRSHK